MTADQTPATTPRLRRPGSPWRLTAHHWAGRAPGEREGGYDVTHHVTNTPRQATPDGEHHRTHLIEGTEFDELVVGSWLHVEQMNASTWWANLGGVTVHVTADRDGRPRQVWVAGPGDYDTPVEGCTYRLTWGRHDEDDDGREDLTGLRDRYADAISRAFDAFDPGETEDAALLGHLTDAVLAVRDVEVQQLRAEVARVTTLPSEYADRAITNGQRAEQAEVALARVRALADRLALDSPWGRDTAARILAALGDRPATVDPAGPLA